MWTLPLALVYLAGLVIGAPTDEEGRSSSQLPVEHRNPPVITHADVVGDIFDTMFKSQTASALDEAAARIAQTFGGFIDDIGDFFVGTVKEIPGTITKISERVGDVMQNGEEAVVIIVKGLQNVMENPNQGLGQVQPGNNTVEQVFTAINQLNQSKTATVFQELDKKIRLNLGRIGGTVLANADDIDKAIATSIRRVSGADRQPPSGSNVGGANRLTPNSSKVESAPSNTETLIALDLTKMPTDTDDVAPSENEGRVAYQSPFTGISCSASNGPSHVLFYLAIAQLLGATRLINQVR